jgi:histidine triad (HIT) family protein
MDNQMDECLFCKIVNNEVPCEIVFENKHILAFRDTNPQAPTHILVIPRKHISTLNELETEDAELVGEILLTARNLAKVENIDQDGYRTVFNCNKDAGQTVFHIHLHLLGGRRFNWPPG